MVTFALPGEGDDVATPKRRAPLAFSQRPYGASPLIGASAKRGTQRPSSVRKNLTREDLHASTLDNSSISTARNIFRSSTLATSPGTSSFSPSIPPSTKKMLFAPGSTPNPKRVQREVTAKPTPRGLASKQFDQDLFDMKISSPPPELSGEALSRKIPRAWDSNCSIYADQYMADLCPPEFDDEQRRQWFCILDLRRLKYTADEIFVQKGWKLNILNFAKEFEKSRGIIMLRYGLYEFKNVKPSKDLIKRWRREHGLPDLEDDEEETTPIKNTPNSKKRKTDEQLTKESSSSDSMPSNSKRRVTERADEDRAPVAVPAPINHKRKASVSNEEDAQRNKIPKATPSKAKSLFEAAANKTATPNSTSLSKPTNGLMSRSVFSKTPATGTTSPNIFGHLSDASKNSGAEADGESESDSDADEAPDAEKESDAPSAVGSFGAKPAQSGSNMFSKAAAPSPFTKETSSASEAGDTGSSRSLFDRISKNTAGEPMRGEPADDDAPAAKRTAADQTWNPTTTPLKFAPSGTSTSQPLFGGNNTAPSSLFAPKTGTSGLFGASKPDATEKPAEQAKTADKDESDKENDTNGQSKLPEPSQSFGSLFQPKPATEPAKEAEAPKSLFGSNTPTPASSAAPTLFGKPAAPAPTSNIFGAKPAEPAAAEPAPTGGLFVPKANTGPPDKSSPLFGAKSDGNASSAFAGFSASSASTLFGAPKDGSKPANLFGNAKPAEAPAAAPLFGAAKPSAAPVASPMFGAPKPAETATTATTATPTFSFGAKPAEAPAKATTPPSTASSFNFGANKAAETPKPLFGGLAPPAGGMFGGSPMKQDEASPAKKPMFSAGSDGNAAPSFAFGGPSTTSTPMFGGSTAAPSTSLFGNSSGPATNGASATAAPSAPNFNFAAGGASGNNPFAFGGNASNGGGGAAPSTGGMFSFGGSSTPAPSGTNGSMFGSQNNAAPAPAPAPAFGGAPAANNNPFAFQAANGSVLSSNPNPPSFGNQQAGGPTTGTSKSPFPRRKIAPLKRRV